MKFSPVSDAYRPVGGRVRAGADPTRDRLCSDWALLRTWASEGAAANPEEMATATNAIVIPVGADADLTLTLELMQTAVQRHPGGFWAERAQPTRY